MPQKKKRENAVKSVLIKNYGLFWEHDKVNWNKKPSLMGCSSKKKKYCFDEQIGIYVLYNENKEILYVGQAGNGDATLLTRLKRHNSDHLEGWWTYFSWFGLLGTNKSSSLLKWSKKNFHVDRSKLLDSLEGILIAAINPKLNKQGEKLGQRFKQVEYCESTDSKKIIDKLEEIHSILKKIKIK
jgi:hypothetical protein